MITQCFFRLRQRQNSSSISTLVVATTAFRGRTVYSISTTTTCSFAHISSNTSTLYPSRIDPFRKQHFHSTAIPFQHQQKHQQSHGTADDTASTTSTTTTTTTTTATPRARTVPNNTKDIKKMSSKEMKDELISYGINTVPLFEKEDVYIALEKARQQDSLPNVNAMTAMKYELVHYHNITNLDQYLERSDLESAFLQNSESIRTNMEAIIFPNNDTTATTTTTTNDNDNGSTDNNIEHDDDDNVPIDMIYIEMASCCRKLSSIQQMHIEMEQQLLISPVKLLQSCIAIARVDGIITIRSDETKTLKRHRLLPSEVWKSLNVPTIVIDAYLDINDRRKTMLHVVAAGSDYSNTNKIENDNNNTKEDECYTPSDDNSNDKQEEVSTTTTLLLSRTEQIQNERSKLEMVSMKQLFNELENVWGISPRCIYICTIAVLRVLNVRLMMEGDDVSLSFNDDDDPSTKTTNTVLDDPEIQTLVDTAMSNPEMDTLLSNAIMKPHIRNMVMEYIQNPERGIPNVSHDDPEIKKIFSNPIFLQQMQHIVDNTTTTTTTTTASTTIKSKSSFHRDPMKKGSQ